MARNGPTVAIYEFSFISKQSIYTNDKDGGRSKNLRGMIVKQHLFLLFSILVNNALQWDEGVGHVPPVLLQFCRPWTDVKTFKNKTPMHYMMIACRYAAHNVDFSLKLTFKSYLIALARVQKSSYICFFIKCLYIFRK